MGGGGPGEGGGRESLRDVSVDAGFGDLARDVGHGGVPCHGGGAVVGAVDVVVE